MATLAKLPVNGSHEYMDCKYKTFITFLSLV